MSVRVESLLDFRKRFPIKPYDVVLYEGRKMEAISFPWPNGDGASINIREAGDPSTLITITLAVLARLWATKTVQTDAISRGGSGGPVATRTPDPHRVKVVL